MLVVLSLDSYYSDDGFNDLIPDLRRWLNRIERTEKKGAQTDVSYLVPQSQWHVAEFLKERGQRIQGERKLAELRKILDALGNPKSVKPEWLSMRFGGSWCRILV